ncbi:elongation of very long chain fatty acids protein-like protein [Dinothrombium tinctorium]|uniref:Elongation of very long chain fatty acids protein n=1 Tax=Dinothrombium tinctorium TaxID=1965070 RepID=A0A3S3PHV8_9ACAR|nr:elongation of very long chain fatty acids protein-like protein [Dinothrombium tinctorium]
MSLKYLFDVYKEIFDNGAKHFDKYFNSSTDKRLNHWMFMSSPMPTILMTAAYLYFVKILGPKLMQNRPPFELRKVMIVYNFTMVITSLVMFIEMGRLIEWGRYTFRCQKVDYSEAEIPMRMCRIGWYFLVTKYIEFADTVFFVLRKKQNQVSNLHVIHHSAVPISVWFAVKYAPGGNNALFPVLNSGVHTIMYLYYGLAAFGPSIQKYLWWKRYITTIQILQFFLIIIHGFSNFLRDCDFPRPFILLNVFHGILFSYLFTSFYRQSYRKKDKNSKGGLAISATALPDGASTSARIGDVTITASLHYSRNSENCCQNTSAHKSGEVNTTVNTFRTNEEIDKKLQ